MRQYGPKQAAHYHSWYARAIKLQVLPAGVIFESFTKADINNDGHVAFFGTLRGTNSTLDTGIWTQNSMGQLGLIAREGKFIDVAPGDARQILSLDAFFGEPNFNDLGEIAFHAEFTDGTSGHFRRPRESQLHSRTKLCRPRDDSRNDCLAAKKTVLMMTANGSITKVRRGLLPVASFFMR